MTDSGSSLFASGRFAVALVTVGLGTAAGMAYVPVVGTYVGTLLGGFAAGLVFEDRPLLESGVAAALSAVGAILASKLVGNGIIDAIIGLISMSPQALLVSAALSFLAGALGAHFGNDLRDGLTRPVDDTGGEPDEV